MSWSSCGSECRGLRKSTTTIAFRGLLGYGSFYTFSGFLSGNLVVYLNRAYIGVCMYIYIYICTYMTLTRVGSSLLSRVRQLSFGFMNRCERDREDPSYKQVISFRVQGFGMQILT